MPVPPTAEELKFLAEAKAADALAEYNLAEARKATIEADRELLDLDAARRKLAKELASDDHHHVYAFNSEVNAGSVRKCIDQLTTWMRTDPGCDIEIVFNSPGGDVIEGMALWDYIQLVKAAGHNVTTSTIGYAASMAGILLQAGTTRVMGKQAWLMLHEASFTAWGKTSEVEDRAEWVKRVQERILDIFAERSNLTKATIKRRWHRKDYWINSDEALRDGFVDEVR